METIILKPKDKDELNFFLELAKRLGVRAQTFEDLQDEQLLNAMEENRKTPKTSKKSVLDTIQNILNEDKATYKL
jgi:succinate dehydrogenase flavin-adding protein (antitoxin of CptAB toxin-antitoxin module)